MWSSRGEERSVADAYADNGVHLTRAGKGAGSRIARVQRTLTYLGEAPACPSHRAQGWQTCPRIHVFTMCANLIRTLPTLPHPQAGSGVAAEDVDTNAEDHAYDALSYVLVNIGAGPLFVIPDDPPSSVTDGVELLQPHGAWAVRPDLEVSDWFTGDDAEQVNRAGQRSPFT
jgi:hypothetical protein